MQWLRTALAPLALAFGAGAALGIVGWGEGRVPLAALALPVLVACSGSRAQAFLLAAGYAGGVLRHGVGWIAGWFDDCLLAGLAVVAGCALASGATWSCGWSGAAARPLRRVAALVLASLLALPAAIAVPGHPVIAAGFATPGAGWLGVLLACALPAGLPAALLALPVPRWQRRGLLLLLVASLVGGGVLIDAPPPSAQHRQVRTMTTDWGALRGPEQVLHRLERMGATAAAGDAGTIVWPESILGRYEPALEPVLQVELLQAARSAGRTLVIGVDLPAADGRLRNAALAFHPDGRRSLALARQPAPLALWQPWRRHHGFIANWGADNILQLPGGERAALIFCFEEYLPLLVLFNEARDAPTLYLVLANSWAAPDPAASAIQTWHSLGMARLFGRSYLKAENRPAPR